MGGERYRQDEHVGIASERKASLQEERVMRKRMMVVVLASMFSAAACEAIETLKESTGVAVSSQAMVSELQPLVDEVVGSRKAYAEYIRERSQANKLIGILKALPAEKQVERAKAYIALSESHSNQAKYLEAYGVHTMRMTVHLVKLQERGVMKNRVQKFIRELMSLRASLIHSHQAKLAADEITVAKIIHEEAICRK